MAFTWKLKVKRMCTGKQNEKMTLRLVNFGTVSHQMLGFACFSRTETDNTHSNYSNNNRMRTEYYSAHDKCFRFSIPFISKQGSQDLFLEPGEYSYPFQIQLASNLPTSFEGKNGRIRYSLTSAIDIPWAFDQHTYKAITVISHVDLNLDPTLRRPYNLCESKTVCCCCCKSGPISATLCLKKTGFVCGWCASSQSCEVTKISFCEKPTLFCCCC